MNSLSRGVITLLISAAVCLAQAAAGSVTQTNVTTVTALAPTTASASQIACQFTNPARPTVHVVCTQNGATVLTMDMTPAVGATNGAVGSINLAGQAVTWIVQQPTAGAVTWTIAANGSPANGTF